MWGKKIWPIINWRSVDLTNQRTNIVHFSFDNVSLGLTRRAWLWPVTTQFCTRYLFASRVARFVYVCFAVMCRIVIDTVLFSFVCLSMPMLIWVIYVNISDRFCYLSRLPMQLLLLFHITLGCEMYNVLSLVVADIPPVDFFPCLCLLSSSFVFPFG